MDSYSYVFLKQAGPSKMIDMVALLGKIVGGNVERVTSRNEEDERKIIDKYNIVFSFIK